MNLLDRPILPGLPIPDDIYENYVCEPLARLAVDGYTLQEVRDELDALNARGETYVCRFKDHRGVEMVAGYVFEERLWRKVKGG